MVGTQFTNPAPWPYITRFRLKKLQIEQGGGAGNELAVTCFYALYSVKGISIHTLLILIKSGTHLRQSGMKAAIMEGKIPSFLSLPCQTRIAFQSTQTNSHHTALSGLPSPADLPCSWPDCTGTSIQIWLHPIQRYHLHFCWP